MKTNLRVSPESQGEKYRNSQNVHEGKNHEIRQSAAGKPSKIRPSSCGKKNWQNHQIGKTKYSEIQQSVAGENVEKIIIQSSKKI